uniref:(California timema) hypothetical protein n=1 Tax=Timema californicum TaxID=61474 RepID=A0A7R9P940_TIMCA|nr:unnamed protein product [Timema californicum]
MMDKKGRIMERDDKVKKLWRSYFERLLNTEREGLVLKEKEEEKKLGVEMEEDVAELTWKVVEESLQQTMLRDGTTLPPADLLMRQLIDLANAENPPCANCDKRDKTSMYFCSTCGIFGRSSGEVATWWGKPLWRPGFVHFKVEYLAEILIERRKGRWRRNDEGKQNSLSVSLLQLQNVPHLEVCGRPEHVPVHSFSFWMILDGFLNVVSGLLTSHWLASQLDSDVCPNWLGLSSGKFVGRSSGTMGDPDLLEYRVYIDSRSSGTREDPDPWNIEYISTAGAAELGRTLPPGIDSPLDIFQIL